MEKLAVAILAFFLVQQMWNVRALDVTFYRRPGCYGEVVGSYKDVQRDKCVACEARAVSVQVSNATKCQNSYAFVTDNDCADPEWSLGSGDFCHSHKWIYSGLVWRKVC